MRTNTRVEFGLYDVTARGDSTPNCTTTKPFCNLGRDLLLESVPSQNKYGTLESEQWLMDGSFSFFPEVPEQYFWGLWSTTQSDKSGVFADPPVLDITFTQDHSSRASRCTFTAQPKTGPAASKSSGSAKTEDLSLRRSSTRTRWIITAPRR